jgi:hypothetical protein
MGSVSNKMIIFQKKQNTESAILTK